MGIPSFMAILPTWEVAALFVGFSVALAMATTFYIRRTPWFGRNADGAEFIGLMYPMIGAIYGVVLAFTIVLSWQRFAEAETYTSSEVTHLSSIWRNSQAFACSDQISAESRLLAYARSVVDDEWMILAYNGEEHSQTTGAYEDIWRFYRNYVPATYTEQRFYEAALGQLSELGIQRRLRTMSATSEISGIVWAFLSVGGIVTVMIPMFFWTKVGSVQIAVNGVMAFIISFSLWIVASLQYPYSGDVSVSSAPFKAVIESFEKRRHTDHKCAIQKG
jgi:hypothetical protein